MEVLVDAVEVQAVEVEGRHHGDEGEERHKQPRLAHHGGVWGEGAEGRAADVEGAAGGSGSLCCS